MREEMFKNFCIKLQAKLKEYINGRIYVASYPEYNVVLVKICYDQFFFTHLIGNVEEKFSEDPDMLNTAANDVVKYYKRSLYTTFIKNYEKKEESGNSIFKIPYTCDAR